MLMTQIRKPKAAASPIPGCTTSGPGMLKLKSGIKTFRL